MTKEVELKWLGLNGVGGGNGGKSQLNAIVLELWME